LTIERLTDSTHIPLQNIGIRRAYAHAILRHPPRRYPTQLDRLVYLPRNTPTT